jgi:hypothetical protein
MVTVVLTEASASKIASSDALNDATTGNPKLSGLNQVSRLGL